VLLKVKLIEGYHDVRLPKQLAEPTHSASVLGAFVPVADENVLLNHG
jgi:hypothetical protein